MKIDVIDIISTAIFNNNLVSLGNDPNDGTEYHGKSSGHQG